MLLKKSIFFSLILLLVSIPTSSEDPSSQDKSPSFKILTENERSKLIKSLLLRYNKSVSKYLIKNILELTDGYTTPQIKDILIDMMAESTKNTLEPVICKYILKKAIHRNDTDQMKQQKLAQLEEINLIENPFDPDWTIDPDDTDINF